MRPLHTFFVFLLAPLLGLMLALSGFISDSQAFSLPIAQTGVHADNVGKEARLIREALSLISDSAALQTDKFAEQQSSLNALALLVDSHHKASDQLYEERILAMLGPPLKTHKSNRVELKIFQLDELGYRGYIAKLKLFDPTAFRVVLGQDTPGQKETTLDAAKRTGAILAINGGGFFTETREGKPYAMHMGNLIIDGQLIGAFNPYPENLFFAGINKRGEFIGGIYYEPDSLMALAPWQGVSFLPVLIKGGLVRPIDKDWAMTKQPRTIIGEYANGDFIMIVVDGRQNNWSSGVTLERLLEKLVELGVKEGYNLDGGGSSTFVYDGKVLNRPSDGKPRAVVTNIVIYP